jgi:hypothetical protein
MQYDFRQIYASVLGQWYGAPETEIAPAALPRHFDQLPIFDVVQAGVETPGSLASFQLGQNYPNPAIGRTTIPLEGLGYGSALLTVYGSDGRAVLSRTVTAGERSVEIETGGLPSGSYVYEVASGGARRSKTMIVRH